MKSFLFIRHPQTQWNVEARMQGIKESPLTEHGKESVRQFIRRFQPQFQLDVIYYAHNKRTEFLARRLYRKFRKQYRLSLMQDARLNEKGFGSYEGATTERVKKETGYHAGPLEARYTWKPPGGDSYEETLPVVQSFLDELKRSPYEHGLCITSGGIIKLALHATGLWDITGMFTHKVKNLDTFEITL